MVDDGSGTHVVNAKLSTTLNTRVRSIGLPIPIIKVIIIISGASGKLEVLRKFFNWLLIPIVVRKSGLNPVLEGPVIPC